MAKTSARDFKHVTLELGGKSPNIVFADAKLDDAAKGVIAGFLSATGQTCVAGSRLLVERRIHHEFVARLVELAGGAIIGDPMDGGTHIGAIPIRPPYVTSLDYTVIAKAEACNVALAGRTRQHPSPPVGLER